MRKQYDDFTQMKPKEMSKAMSDMTYQYINPETKAPTVVPASHYEKILDRVKEQYMSEITSRQFLTIMYSQLSALRKEDEKYFQQALLCLDMGINPKDLRINEQVAISLTYDYVQDRQRLEKKDFHFLNQDVVDMYKETLENPEIQAQAVAISNDIEEQEARDLEYIKEQDSKAQEEQTNPSFNNEYTSIEEEHDDYDRDY